jgi:superfamily II DNA or RNA helicase
MPPSPPAELGDITLLPHQRDAVARIQTAIRLHHGALLADDVGLGKTYTALAVACAYAQVHVIAPAALQPMWSTAITHAQLPHIRLHSVHGFSRQHDVPIATMADDAHPGLVREQAPQRTLVIIDEAHYLRTRRTAPSPASWPGATPCCCPRHHCTTERPSCGICWRSFSDRAPICCRIRCSRRW